MVHVVRDEEGFAKSEGWKQQDDFKSKPFSWKFKIQVEGKP